MILETYGEAYKASWVTLFIFTVRSSHVRLSVVISTRPYKNLDLRMQNS